MAGKKRLTVGDQWNKIFKPKFGLIQLEYNVYGDFNLLPECSRFGIIDYIAYYNRNYFIIEEDLPISGLNKFHWAKVFAYRAAFILDRTPIKLKKIKCAVFLPVDCFSYQLRNILSFCGVEWFFFSIKNDIIKCAKTSMPEVLKNGL